MSAITRKDKAAAGPPAKCERCGNEAPLCGIREAPDYRLEWLGKQCFEEYLARKLKPVKRFLGMVGGVKYGG